MFSGGRSSGELIPVLLPTSSTTTKLMSPSSSSSWREKRVPPVLTQWGPEETRDLIKLRGEMEKEEAVAPKGSNKKKKKKKNKTVWEWVSSRMRDMGYYRTPEQCKCKWKNLLHSYKRMETADTESGQLCPFFEELHSVFNGREKKMHRLLLESEAGSIRSRKRVKQMAGDGSPAEFSYGGYKIEHDCEEEEEKACRNSSRNINGQMAAVVRYSSPHEATDVSGSSGIGSIHELLREFLQQQQRMEMGWMEIMERCASKYELFEEEWQQSMEKLEQERLMIDQAWRERDEQRRIREENRAEKRDALLSTLLNQLLSEDNV